MSETQHVCAFYSRGPHFVRLLKKLRIDYPGAQITAMIPAAFPPEAIAGLADHVVTVPESARTGRNLKVLRRLAAALRKGRFDVLFIMFDSPRLRGLAALSGARTRLCFHVDGRITPVRFNPISQGFSAVSRGIRGRLLYAYIRHIVYTRPVRK